jgi:hypothetical protein
MDYFKSICNIAMVDIFYFLLSGETGFAALAKNPEFVAAIQKSFANQENKRRQNVFNICSKHIQGSQQTRKD